MTLGYSYLTFKKIQYVFLLMNENEYVFEVYRINYEICDKLYEISSVELVKHCLPYILLNDMIFLKVPN